MRRFLKFTFIFLLITGWLMSGFPPIWQNPRIPSTVKIVNAATTTKFYLHNGTSPDTGTLPSATTLSATTPNVTATGAGTNRDMDVVIGSAQASGVLTTLAQTALQKNWFRRFLSKPLAAQTLPTGIWTVQGGASESSLASNLLLWGAVIKVWRPSTGVAIATLLDNPTLGATEPSTSETNISQNTASITGVAINDGDIIVLELWGQNKQGNGTARTNTIFYNGTTEASITSNAAFLLAPGAITMQAPTFNQSAYRLFNNVDSTDVGTVLAAQDTAATLGSTGAAFRLRMLLHIDLNKLFLSDQAFKLQFAQQSGTCDTGFVGETYADVTAATVIAYNDNPTPVDGATLTANVNDPTHGADTIVNQTYEELNNFTNSVAAIPSGQDGKWDFSLKDNGATASTAYCLRAVKSDGSVLNTYTVIPQITTAAVASTVSCSTNITSTAFGTLGTGSISIASPNASTTMTCSGTSLGCSLRVSDAGNGVNPGLATTSPAYLIPSTTVTLSAGAEGYGIQATTTAAGSGGTLTLNSIYNKTGNNVGGLSLTNVVLASSTVDVTGREVVVTHKAAISATTQAGAYSDTITYSCVAN